MRKRSRMIRAVILTGLVVGLVSALVLAGAEVALAAPAGPSAGIDAVRSFAQRLTNYVTAIAASVAVLFLAINGVRYTTSGGNHLRQVDAKNGLVSAAIGLAVALSANLIVSLVISALG